MNLKSAALVTAAGVLAMACHRVEGKEAAPVRPVKAMSVQAVESMTRVRYAVNLEADLEVSLAFKSAGYVDRVSQRRGADGRTRAIQQGDFVQAGTRLASVREDEYRERVNRADGAKREAAAAVVKAARDWDRAQTLFASLSLTRPELDSAAASYETAQARAGIAGADAELAAIALADVSLDAPFSGVVLERHVEVGDLVSSGSVAFRLGRVSTVKAVFGVPDSLVARLKNGMALDMTSEALAAETFSGRVTSISPAADRDAHTFNVEVTIPNANGRLKPGMVGAVQIETRDAAGTMGYPVVPLTSIVRSGAAGSDYAVFVVERSGDRDVARIRLVSLGSAAGNMMTVTSGLRNGELVVTMGAGLLRDQEPVRVIP